MTDCHTLLSLYARTGSESAFRELVTRYLDLVYSTAFRLVGGDAQSAQDATQTVFLALADKAGTLPQDVMPGVRQRGLPPELVAHRPGVSPPAKLPSKRWRDLILRVWHADPLRCPVCQSSIRVIAVIDDPRGVETILRHRPPPARFAPQSRYCSRIAWPLGRCRPSTLSAMGQNRQKLDN